MSTSMVCAEPAAANKDVTARYKTNFMGNLNGSN
jgi:hypothetical protein